MNEGDFYLWLKFNKVFIVRIGLKKRSISSAFHERKITSTKGVVDHRADGLTTHGLVESQSLDAVAGIASLEGKTGANFHNKETDFL